MPDGQQTAFRVLTKVRSRPNSDPHGRPQSDLLRTAFAMLRLPVAHLPGETYRWTLADRGSAHSGRSAPHGRPIHL